MTTKITVDAHAGWPVQVVAEDRLASGALAYSTFPVIAPGEVKEFVVFEGRRLIVTELARPATPTQVNPEPKEA